MDFDFQLMNSVTQSASGLSGALKVSVDALTGLKALLKAPERRSEAEIEAAVAQVALAMDNAKLNNLLLETQISMLSQAIAKASEAQAQLDRYALHKTEAGSFVYRLKDTDAAGEPSHFICEKCHTNGRRSILHGDGRSKRCKECSASYQFIPDRPYVSY